MKELGIDMYSLTSEELRPRAVPVQNGGENASFLTEACGRIYRLVPE